MLRDVLERIGKDYLAAKDESFKSHPLARFIRKDGPEEVGRVIAEQNLISKGGCGVSGQWAYVPWIGLFDPAITLAEGVERVSNCLQHGGQGFGQTHKLKSLTL